MEQDFLPKLPEHTPDKFLLDQAEHHFVFCCNTRHSSLEVTPAYTVEKMTLWKYKNNPLVIKAPEMPKARIAGTLCLYTGAEIEELDKEFTNGVHFERRRTEVYVPLQNGHGELAILPQKVWMYRAIPKAWKGEIWREVNKRCGNYHTGDFELAPTYPDNNKTLHVHFSFKPPVPRVSFVGIPTRMVTSHCIKNNHEESKRIDTRGWLKKLLHLK